MLKKCPELVEDFIERVVVLLVERSHGVVLCGVQVQSGGGGRGGVLMASCVALPIISGRIRDSLLLFAPSVGCWAVRVPPLEISACAWTPPGR